MKHHQNKKGSSQILPVILAVVLSSAASFLIFGYFQRPQATNNDQTSAKLESLAKNRSSQKSGDDVDPYLKGPVKNRIIQNAKVIQSCYLDLNKQSKEPKSGKIKIDWQIQNSGAVNKAGVVFSELEDSTFEKCLVEKISQLEFPPPPYDQYYVEHTFLFKPEEAESSENTESIVR